MKKRYLTIIALALIVGFVSVNAKATLTIATFADPSKNSANPLFNVNFISDTITGGWAQGKTGLKLEIPFSGNNFADAWFTMTDLTITPTGTMAGETNGGTIKFYASGAATPTPLLQIDFESGDVSRYGLGANGMLTLENVRITGSEITNTIPTGYILKPCEFSFSFSNLAKLPRHSSWNEGFTSTAALTSSGTITKEVPEPATMSLLGLGALSLVRRKK